MISSYEELLQYVRKLENALDVREEGGITTTEIGGHLEVDGDIKQNGESVALYIYNINDSDNYFSFKFLSPIYMGVNSIILDDSGDISQDILKNLYNAFKNYYLSTYNIPATNNKISAINDNNSEDPIATLQIGYNADNSTVTIYIASNSTLVDEEILLNDNVYSVNANEGYAFISCTKIL